MNSAFQLSVSTALCHQTEPPLTSPFSLYLTRGRLSADVGGAGDASVRSNLTGPGEKEDWVVFHGLDGWEQRDYYYYCAFIMHRISGLNLLRGAKYNM